MRSHKSSGKFDPRLTSNPVTACPTKLAFFERGSSSLFFVDLIPLPSRAFIRVNTSRSLPRDILLGVYSATVFNLFGVFHIFVSYINISLRQSILFPSIIILWWGTEEIIRTHNWDGVLILLASFCVSNGERLIKRQFLVDTYDQSWIRIGPYTVTHRRYFGILIGVLALKPSTIKRIIGRYTWWNFLRIPWAYWWPCW